MFERTINKKIEFSGIGVHTGLKTTVALHPAPAGHGIVFVNPKFAQECIKLGTVIPEIALHASVLKSKSYIISTIEHLMAAINAFKIDNILIEISGIEVPILDGSSINFVNLINNAGIKELEAKKTYLTPVKTLYFKDENSDREIVIYPANFDKETNSFDTNLYFDYFAEFEHALVGKSSIVGEFNIDFFEHEIAPARTFGFLEQLPYLRSKGLAKGTSLGNTVVIGEDEYLNEPRFENEFVRHKLLDLLGDIGLLGKNLAGKIVAKKTGHSFNRLVVQDYINNPENWKLI
jgi:UDP-3-O-[3-hydroxymyristoyl] N-acetylglucosamine deacetylase